MSLSSLLPAPRHVESAVSVEEDSLMPAAAAAFEPPPYGQRAGFVPRSEADFGDGGAFPEIHTPQYPRGMGRKDKKGARGAGGALALGQSQAVVPLSVDAAGAVAFDAVVKQGHAKHVVVHSGYTAMSAKNEAKMDLSRPSAEDEERMAEETKKALGMIVEKKIATGMPTHVAKHSKEAVFIKYTPSEQNASFNSGAQQRIIRLQEMPVDPMQPPKFKHAKLPPGPPDAPVPVMHSPPRKITAEDQAAWKIPPCIDDDHQLLTNRGFIGIHEIRAHFASAGSSAPVLRVACYDAASKSIMYRVLTPEQVVDREYSSAQEGPMMHFRCEGAHTNAVDVSVTSDHLMYACLGTWYLKPGGASRTNYFSDDAFLKHKAGAVGDIKNVLKFRGAAQHGIAIPASTSDAAANNVMSALSIKTNDAFVAFLKLYGYWLGDGAMRYNAKGKYIRLIPVKNHDKIKIREWLAAIGLQRDRDYNEASTESAIGQLEIDIKRRDWVDFFWAEYASHYDGTLGVQSHDAAPASSFSSAVAASASTQMSVDYDESKNSTPTRDLFAEAVGAARSSSSVKEATASVQRQATRTVKYSIRQVDGQDEYFAVCNIGDCTEEVSSSSIGSCRTKMSMHKKRCSSGVAAPVAARAAAADASHVERLVSTALPQMPDLVADKDVGIKSAKWLAPWVWQLGKRYLRAIFVGLRYADGAEAADNNIIFTSSVKFRDALVVLALHAGFTARFDLAAPAGTTTICRGKEITTRHDAWSVSYSDGRASEPVVYADRDVAAVQRDTHVWCVNVDHPDHLIIVRRVIEMKDGQLTKASRPIIIGNCISNWKNIKGYVIPLDKRLAADGRGLQEVQINDKFAKLSESLFLAERASRTEIEQRASLQKKMARKAKEMQEEELRNMATQARTAAHRDTAAATDEGRKEEGYAAASSREGAPSDSAAAEAGGLSGLGEYHSDTEEDLSGKESRDALRRDRQRDLKRDMRLEAKKVEKGTSSAFRERERDVSEKIALGQAPAASKDSMFDQRLFNQDAGLAAGFGSSDSYDVYSKPLFSGSSTGNVYRPKAVAGMSDEDGGSSNVAVAAGAHRSATSKFQADRGFSGTEHGGVPGGSRAKPVEFERDAAPAADADDPYGLGTLLKDARRPNALDKIGAPAAASAAREGRSDERDGHRARGQKRSRSRSTSRSRSKERRRH